MLDIKFIRENKDVVAKAIIDKKSQPVDLDRLIALADERKSLQQKISDLNQARNAAAAERNSEKGKELKEQLQQLEADLVRVEKEFVALMIKVPNIPSPDTPVGPDESGNKVLRQWGEKPAFTFEPKAHWDLGKELGIIDTESAGEVSGARFAYLLGDLVLMQFALIRLAFETLTNSETLATIAEDYRRRSRTNRVQHEAVHSRAPARHDEIGGDESHGASAPNRRTLFLREGRSRAHRKRGAYTRPSLYGQDPRGKGSAASLCRILDLIPTRGGGGGEGYSWNIASARVR
jgi:hypothetical protein